MAVSALKPVTPLTDITRTSTPRPGARCMTPFERPDRRCPKCEPKGYMFRARRTVEAKSDEGGDRFVETKYRCRSCSHDWWERIPAPPQPRQTDTGDAA